MTQISEIHGIGRDEYADRGAMVSQSGFFPYLSLTQGEARLWLATQRAKTLAQWYGSDAPQYAQAAQMLENALHAGVSNGVNFVGAVPDYLQNVARMIQQASRQTQPATRDGLLLRPQGIVRGIGQLIPYTDRYKQCLEAAKKLPVLKQAGAFAKCSKQVAIEKIYNEAIEKTGHHVIYHQIPDSATMPDRVFTKRTLHLGGVEGMAVVGDIQRRLMHEWVENGILSKNAQIGAGAIGSIKASVELAPNPELAYQKIGGSSSDKWRPGVGSRIGIGPAALVIIGAITAALVAAKDLIGALRKQQATIAATNFGTEAYSGSQYDWDKSDSNPETTAGLDMTTILLIAAGAGLLLLTDDKK